MNTVLARFKIVAGKEAEADEAMKKQAASVESAEPGALTYIFTATARTRPRLPSSKSTGTTKRP